MHGAIPPLSSTSSWRGAKHRDNFKHFFYIINFRIPFLQCFSNCEAHICLIGEVYMRHDIVCQINFKS
jgi:hypothetical protein